MGNKNIDQINLKMKKLFSLLLLTLFLAACSQEANQEPEHPKDLAGKKKLLREKKSELRELNALIKQLNEEIGELDTTKREKPRALVTTQKIKKQDFKHFVEIQGSVVADDPISASSEIGGRLITMPFKEGDFIQRGQVVGKVEMEAVNRQVAELQKSLELAREVYERQDRLWKQNIGTEMQYLQAKNNKERLEKTIETVKYQFTKAEFYAPASGIVDRVMVQQGEVAAPGMPVLMILNTNKVKIVIDVPEIYLKSVRKGSWVDISFPAIEYNKRGKVSAIGRQINPANRTFEVEVEMNNTNGKLKPNLLASMMLNDFSEKNAIALPLELIQQEISGKNYIYIKDNNEEGDIAKKVFVEIGETYEGQILVTEGLNGDEEVIVDGARLLQDNALITVQTVEN